MPGDGHRLEAAFEHSRSMPQSRDMTSWGLRFCLPTCKIVRRP
jgi:hypothetical protein